MNLKIFLNAYCDIGIIMGAGGNISEQKTYCNMQHIF